jgi:hypothetical protein
MTPKPVTLLLRCDTCDHQTSIIAVPGKPYDVPTCPRCGRPMVVRGVSSRITDDQQLRALAALTALV